MGGVDLQERDGGVEQVGARGDLRRALSAYAAGFMGYRYMLELDVAKAGGGHATVANGGLRLRGLDRRTGDGRHAVVAIRPEDFTVGGGENEIRCAGGRRVPRSQLAVEAVAAAERRL